MTIPEIFPAADPGLQIAAADLSAIEETAQLWSQ